MSILHIINTSPSMRTSLQSCLRVAQKDNAIILIENAVIAAKNNCHTDQLIKDALEKSKLFVLEPDLKARGINSDQLIQGIELVDHSGFVKLTVRFDGVQTWS